MRLSPFALAAAFALAGAPALAQIAPQEPGAYYQFNVGVGAFGHTSASGSASGIGAIAGGFRPSPGFFGSMAFGRSFKSGLAIEAEAIYLRNNIKTHAEDALLGVPANAHLGSYGGLANVMYAIAPLGRIVPYVGAGVGYGGVRYSVLDHADTASGLMWQLRAGISVPVTSRQTLDIGYRYFDTPQYDKTFTVDIGGAPSTVNLRAHTGVHVFTIGGRAKF